MAHGLAHLGSGVSFGVSVTEAVYVPSPSALTGAPPYCSLRCGVERLQLTWNVADWVFEVRGSGLMSRWPSTTR